MHVAASVLVDPVVRALAAWELVGATGIIAGYSAAELHGAACAHPDAPAEVLLVPPHQRRSRPGLRVHRDELGPDDVMEIGGLRLTTPLRTAYDLGRWAPNLPEAVVGVDALVRYAAVRLDDLREYASRRGGARAVRQLGAALQLARDGADSPMETRVRLALVGHGLPEPVLQHPVAVGGRTLWLDLAYPAVLLAIEYDGAEHRTAERARRDLVREAQPVRAGWTVLRFSAADVMRRPEEVAARVRHELALRERALGQRAG